MANKTVYERVDDLEERVKKLEARPIAIVAPVPVPKPVKVGPQTCPVCGKVCGHGGAYKMHMRTKHA